MGIPKQQQSGHLNIMENALLSEKAVQQQSGHLNIMENALLSELAVHLYCEWMPLLLARS